MKFLVVFIKIVFVFFSWILAVGVLGIVKANLVSRGASAIMSSVLWMAFPIMLINIFIVFYKGDILSNKCVDKVLMKLTSFFDNTIIGSVFLFLVFLILTFVGSYLTMMGIHCLTVLESFSITILGLLMLVLGLFICLISNSYFKL